MISEIGTHYIIQNTSENYFTYPQYIYQPVLLLPYYPKESNIVMEKMDEDGEDDIDVETIDESKKASDKLIESIKQSEREQIYCELQTMTPSPSITPSPSLD